MISRYPAENHWITIASVWRENISIIASIWRGNNSLHLACKYARIFIRGDYLFQERRLRKSVTFKYFSQHARLGKLFPRFSWRIFSDVTCLNKGCPAKILWIISWILSTDIICSEKRTVFRKRSSSKSVSFEEQIMSKDKYPSMLSRKMDTIVLSLNYFSQHARLEKLENITRIIFQF